MTEPEAGRQQTERVVEFRLMDLATACVQRWRIIVWTVAATLAAAMALHLLMPASYRARTVLVPVQEGGGMRSQLLSQLPAGLLNLADNSSSNQAQIAAILKSSSLADSMVNRLKPEYSHPSDEREIRHILAKRTAIRTGDGRSVIIEVTGRQPGLATRLANEFPGVVNSIVVQLGGQAAVRKQAFLEEQLATARTRLEGSEQRLLEFQQVSDVPEIQEQAKRTLEAAARLQGQIMEQEIRVAQLRRTATADNPELRAATAELGAWQAQLRRLTDNDSRERQVFVNLKDSPELQLAATRLLRDYKKDEQVYISLMAALAETQVDVNNTLPVMSVLDHAEMPKGPVRLPLPLIVGLAAFLGLAFGLTGAVVAEFAHRARQNPNNASFFAAWDQLKLDLGRWVPGRARRQPRLMTRG